MSFLLKFIAVNKILCIALQYFSLFVFVAVESLLCSIWPIRNLISFNDKNEIKTHFRSLLRNYFSDEDSGNKWKKDFDINNISYGHKNLRKILMLYNSFGQIEIINFHGKKILMKNFCIYSHC